MRLVVTKLADAGHERALVHLTSTVLSAFISDVFMLTRFMVLPAR